MYVRRTKVLCERRKEYGVKCNVFDVFGLWGGLMMNRHKTDTTSLLREQRATEA